MTCRRGGIGFMLNPSGLCVSAHHNAGQYPVDPVFAGYYNRVLIALPRCISARHITFSRKPFADGSE